MLIHSRSNGVYILLFTVALIRNCSNQYCRSHNMNHVIEKDFSASLKLSWCCYTVTSQCRTVTHQQPTLSVVGCWCAKVWQRYTFLWSAKILSNQPCRECRNMGQRIYYIEVSLIEKIRGKCYKTLNCIHLPELLIFTVTWSLHNSLNIVQCFWLGRLNLQFMDCVWLWGEAVLADYVRQC